MKIIHFIDELKMGGAQTHVYTMCAENLKRNPKHNITVVSLFGDGELRERFEELGVKVKVFDFRVLLSKKKYFNIVKQIRIFLKKKKPRVVITHLTWSRFLANTAAFLNRIHTRVGFEQGDIYNTSFKFRIINFLSQRMFKKIVVCSNTHKIWTNKTYGISNSRITVYHNCVDINKFDTVKEENYTIFDKPKVDFLFCAVGTLGRGVNKRMDINIKSIIQLNKIGYDVGLVICGDGDQKAELQELIDESNLNHKIKLLGNRPDVKNILSQCDGFCHAAPYEPFGIVAIEAMAMQLAVILPNSGGIKEILDNENGGGFLYEALNVEEQMEKMKLLLDNKDNAIVIGKQARKNVEDNFSSAHYMQRFMNEFY